MPKRFTPLLDRDETFLPAATLSTSLAGLSMETLNSLCFCIGLDSRELHRALESTLGLPGLFDLVQ